MGRKKEIMKIERFYAYVSSLETGREEIKNLISDVKKAEKEVAGKHSL